MSCPQSNSTQITATPTAVAERTRRTPEAPFRADSIGKVTSDSISVGTMPRPSTRMVTVGALKSGRTSSGILDITYPPQLRKATARETTTMRLFRDQRISLSIIGLAPNVRDRGRESESTGQLDE